jgi:hypothetical protein
MFVEAVATAFAVLTGLMAVFSGMKGAGPYLQKRLPAELQNAMNEGAIRGFLVGVPAALITYMITLGT